MIKLLPIHAALVLLASVTAAYAVDDSIRPYIGVSAGCPFSSMNNFSDASGRVDAAFNPGLLGGVTIGASKNIDLGYNIDRVRIEAEAAYRTNKLTRLNGARGQVVHVDGTVSVTDFMVNGILEKANFVSKEMPVSLFLIVGAGIASASVTDVSYNGTTLIAAGKNTQFAYQGGLGVGNELTRNITVDLTYKYLSASQFNFSGVKGDYGSHNIIVGARYVF